MATGQACKVSAIGLQLIKDAPRLSYRLTQNVDSTIAFASRPDMLELAPEWQHPRGGLSARVTSVHDAGY
jgi:hypothetical protein